LSIVFASVTESYSRVRNCSRGDVRVGADKANGLGTYIFGGAWPRISGAAYFAILFCGARQVYDFVVFTISSGTLAAASSCAQTAMISLLSNSVAIGHSSEGRLHHMIKPGRPAFRHKDQHGPSSMQQWRSQITCKEGTQLF
jgi:hypothetical protein